MDLYTYDLATLSAVIQDKVRLEWRDEALIKSKLRTYVQVKDFDSPTYLVKTGMLRYQRSLMARLLCGILPLELEVG